MIYCCLISVPQCVYTIFMQMTARGCVRVYNGSALCTYLNVVDLLLFSMFLLQSHSPCITLLFVCFLEFVCRMSFADVTDQTVLTICAVERSQLRCWLFSSLLYSGFWEAGSSCVWVMFLHPRAQTIWSAPDMVISVSDSGSCATVLCI